jgi:hypothetical protein
MEQDYRFTARWSGNARVEHHFADAELNDGHARDAAVGCDLPVERT